MIEVLTMFGIPFLIGLGIGFAIKGSINRYEKRREFNKHMDDLFKGISYE